MALRPNSFRTLGNLLFARRCLRIGTEWYWVDLVFFHRPLRCLIIVETKLDKFTDADASQMNHYLNYAREHWTHAHENPPVGVILCSEGRGRCPLLAWQPIQPSACT